MKLSNLLIIASITSLTACATASSEEGSDPAATTPEVAASTPVEAPQVDANSLAEGQEQLASTMSDMPYRPCPPALPFECEMAVLEGNPKSNGELFTVRFRTTKPWVMPPHSHPKNERVTIIEGNVNVGFGPELDKSVGKKFGPGDYYVNGAGALHFVWADEPMVLQITGIGPWEVHPHKAPEGAAQASNHQH